MGFHDETPDARSVHAEGRLYRPGAVGLRHEDVTDQK
jgi:hypothetical protein